MKRPKGWWWDYIIVPDSKYVDIYLCWGRQMQSDLESGSYYATLLGRQRYNEKTSIS